MTPKAIIIEAWAITKRERSIRRWGFASSLLETLFDVKLLIYQTYFLYSYIQGDPIGFFKVEEMLYEALPFWGFLTFIIVLLVLFGIEIFLPKMCLGAIIGLAAKSHKKEEVRGGLVLALYNFFPIFALRELFVLANLTIVITIVSLVLRYMADGLRAPIIVLLFIFWIISNLFRFFTNFAEEEIVIRKSGMFMAMARSFKLIISHLKHIVFLLLLLIIISVRILINAVVLFVLPVLITGLGVLFTLFLSPTLSTVIASVLGLILILVASYFFAYLHVFQQTVWTITYMELSKLKDLDVIEVDEGESEEKEAVTEEAVEEESGEIQM